MEKRELVVPCLDAIESGYRNDEKNDAAAMVHRVRELVDPEATLNPNQLQEMLIVIEGASHSPNPRASVIPIALIINSLYTTHCLAVLMKQKP